MKIQLKALFAALFVAAFLVGCADGIVAPTAEVSLIQAEAKGGTKGKDNSNGALLQWKEPLQRDQTTSVRCEASLPCTLWVPAVNSWLFVPAGALDQTTEITMTALAGRDVNFVFAPHGISFNRDVSVVVDQVFATGSGANFVANYWVDEVSNVVERIPAHMAWGFIEFQTDHFSGYALGM